METDIGALLSKEMFVSGTQVNYFLICNFIQKGNTLVLHEVKKREKVGKGA